MTTPPLISNLSPPPVKSGYKKSWGSFLVASVIERRTWSGGVYTGMKVTEDSSIRGRLGEEEEQEEPKHCKEERKDRGSVLLT